MGIFFQKMQNGVPKAKAADCEAKDRYEGKLQVSFLH